MNDVRVQQSVRAAVAKLGSAPGPLLEILHIVQDDLGCVPAEAVPLIADALNLSRAEVHGVITFYHHFRQRPAGEHVLQLCRAEACQSMNGRALEDAVRARFGAGPGETTGDAQVTIEAVYCLGLCACAPAAMADGQPLGRVDAARIDQLAGAWGVK